MAWWGAGRRATARRRRWLDGLVGSIQPVLMEGKTGHADNFAPVAVHGAARGEIVEARITGRDGNMLTGVRA